MFPVSVDGVLLAKLRAEREGAIEQFLTPITKLLPDKRLGYVVTLTIQGISSNQSPLITQMPRASKTI